MIDVTRLTAWPKDVRPEAERTPDKAVSVTVATPTPPEPTVTTVVERTTTPKAR